VCCAEVMSLAKDCGEEDVKKRHRELVRMVHPD
jgi:curved DNA-binding protein CbpA